MSQKNFLKGAAILAMIGVICKVIGAIFRIPLTNMIGTQGMAYYSTAYPVYNWLLVISSAGLPVAISKMVSERVTINDYRGAHSVFKTAFQVLAYIGFFTTGVLLLLSGYIADVVGRPNANIVLLTIAPSLLFVSVLSAYRGYFQGLQIMSPTAFSQLIEQLGKLGLGLFFANLWKDYGIAYGAAGAILGVTLSELLALLFLVFLYHKHKRVIKEPIPANSSALPSEEKSGILRQLFILAFPIVLGALAMPTVQIIDTAIVTNSLLGLGYSQAYADSLFGTLTSVVNPLINMPAILSLALAMSLVPAISASHVKNNLDDISTKSGMGFKLALFIGLPCAVGFFLLAKPIIQLLYSSLSQQELQIAGILLAIMAVGVLFLTVVQTTTGILQGLGKTYLPVINLFLGIIVKIVASLVLIRISEINIKGAAIGTVACYIVAAILDVLCVIRYAKLKFSLGSILKPIVATAGMGLFVFATSPILFQIVPAKLATLMIIASAIILYVVFSFAIGVFTKDDMNFFPGGSKITNIMVRLRIWR